MNDHSQGVVYDARTCVSKRSVRVRDSKKRRWLRISVDMISPSTAPMAHGLVRTNFSEISMIVF